MPRPEVFTRLGNLLAWCLVPLAVLMQVVHLRRSVSVAGVHLTLELILFALIVAVTSPWWWARRAQIGRRGGLLLGSFASLVAYALLTVAVRPQPHVLAPASIGVSKSWIVIPLVTAILAAWAAVGLVISGEERLRPRILAVAGVALVVSGLATWPRAIAVHGDPRLSTNLGGAATIHVVFLLVAAVGLGLFASGALKIPGAVLAVAGVGCVLATLSRAGLVALAVWVALLVLGRFLRGGRALVQLRWVAVALAVVVAAFALFPALSRALSFADPKRTVNLESALAWWLDSPPSIVFGTGAGQVWPWYAFDEAALPIREDHLTSTPFGDVLLSPHSTLLAIVVELGVVGALIGVVALIALVATVLSCRQDPFLFPVAAAVTAALVAFLFDAYLLKNFGVSFWWWVMAAVCFLPALTRPPKPADPV